MSAWTLSIRTATHPYDVVVEPGGLAGLGARVAALAPRGPIHLAVDEAVAETHGAAARASLDGAGLEVAGTTVLEARESAKTVSAVHGLWRDLAASRVERGGLLVAVGGGIVGDVAGFAASSWLRGIGVVQVPTTLLAMVDASVGGKTGVNLELPGANGEAGRLGKNLAGAFWPPALVLADPDVLATMDERDFRCGFAECVKHAVIRDAALLDRIETAVPRLAARDAEALATLVADAVRVKARVVEADERERGERALLNLGHTFAHAIESMPALDRRHGEAVATGTVAAAQVAVATGRMTADEAERVSSVLVALGLPVRLPDGAAGALAALRDVMRLDKKVEGGRVRLVLPLGIGDAEVVDDVPADVVDAGWRAVGAS